MEFDSYIDWYNNLLTMPLNDVILGVKNTDHPGLEIPIFLQRVYFLPTGE